MAKTKVYDYNAEMKAGGEPRRVRISEADLCEAHHMEAIAIGRKIGANIESFTYERLFSETRNISGHIQLRISQSKKTQEVEGKEGAWWYVELWFPGCDIWSFRGCRMPSLKIAKQSAGIQAPRLGKNIEIIVGERNSKDLI